MKWKAEGAGTGGNRLVSFLERADLNRPIAKPQGGLGKVEEPQGPLSTRIG